MAKRRRPKQIHRGNALIEKGQPEAFHFMSFEVTWESMPDPRVAALPKATRDRMQEIFGLVHRKPKSVIPELRDLVARHPGVPCLTNWLISALRSGTKAERREALEICERLFHEMPGYFFARTTLADLWLDEGEIEKAAGLLFGPECVLTRLYPVRDVFHISEIRHWAYLCARAKILLGEPDVAESYRDMLEEMEPGSPAARQLNEMLDGDNSVFVRLLAEMKKRTETAKAAGRGAEDF